MPSSELPKPELIISKMQRTDAFANTLRSENFQEMGMQEKRSLFGKAMARSAFELVAQNSTESGHKNAEGQVFDIVGNLQPALEAEVRMGLAKAEGTYKRREHLEDIGATIDYNNSLRDFINANPRLRPADVKDFLRDMYSKMFGSKDARYFDQMLGVSVAGMREELKFEQLIGNIEGLTYEDSTRRQELRHGADYIITLDGHTFGVDVKSKEENADKANAKDKEYNKTTTRRVFTGSLRTDTFRLTPEEIKELLPGVEAQLREAINLNYSIAA